jgi:hypothetical protein
MYSHVNWPDVVVGAAMGAIFSFVVTVAIQDALLRRMQYGGASITRRFAYTRCYEIAGSVLSMVLPETRFVKTNGSVSFNGTLARQVGIIVSPKGEDTIRACVKSACSTDAQLGIEAAQILLGYLQELDLIIMTYGAEHRQDELARLISFSRSLGALARVCRQLLQTTPRVEFKTSSERATLALTVSRAITLRAALQRSAGHFVIGSRTT